MGVSVVTVGVKSGGGYYKNKNNKLQHKIKYKIKSKGKRFITIKNINKNKKKLFTTKTKKYIT